MLYITELHILNGRYKNSIIIELNISVIYKLCSNHCIKNNAKELWRLKEISLIDSKQQGIKIKIIYFNMYNNIIDLSIEI